MSSRRAIATTVVPLLLLVACSAEDREPAPARASGASGGSAAVTVDYPDDGLDLVGAPRLDGVYAQAWRTYVDFERGRRRTAREGRIDRLLAFNATARVVDPYRAALREYDDRGAYGGSVTVEVEDARPHGDRLLLDLCVDATQLQVPDGAPAQLGVATRVSQRVVVSNIVGSWRVTGAAPGDRSC
jgi:hypothetical protein